jgi:hypothetical protein
MNITSLPANRPAFAPGRLESPAPATKRADTEERLDTELILSFKKPTEETPTMSVEGAGPDRRVSFLRKLFSF